MVMPAIVITLIIMIAVIAFIVLVAPMMIAPSVLAPAMMTVVMLAIIIVMVMRFVGCIWCIWDVRRRGSFGRCSRRLRMCRLPRVRYARRIRLCRAGIVRRSAAWGDPVWLALHRRRQTAATATDKTHSP